MLNTESQAPRAAPEYAQETELISRAAHGDELAFEAIMRHYNRKLFRTARSILRSDAEAEDALQEAYLLAWRGLSRFRLEANLSTWLVRIVVNEALGRLRRTKAQVIPLDAAMKSPDPDVQASLTERACLQPEPSAMRGQLRALMEARIELLPDLYRTVFMLRAVEEMSVDEVAAALQLPEATVRTRYFRARSLLREGLASDIDLALDEVFAFDGARCDRIVAAVLAQGGNQGLSNP